MMKAQRLIDCETYHNFNDAISNYINKQNILIINEKQKHTQYKNNNIKQFFRDITAIALNVNIDN